MCKVLRLESALEFILFYYIILQAKGVVKVNSLGITNSIKILNTVIWAKWELKNGLPLNPVPLQW